MIFFHVLNNNVTLCINDDVGFIFLFDLTLCRYTRNLVDAGNGKFNLMILCWGEGHGSAVHDHADAHCFMKILEGSLSEVRFAWPAEDKEEGMRETSRNILKQNEVCYMNGNEVISLIKL